MQLELFDIPEKKSPSPAKKPSFGPVKKKKQVNWNELNHDPKKFPYFTKTYGYFIEHISTTFQSWTGLEDIEFVEANPEETAKS